MKLKLIVVKKCLVTTMRERKKEKILVIIVEDLEAKLMSKIIYLLIEMIKSSL